MLKSIFFDIICKPHSSGSEPLKRKWKCRFSDQAEEAVAEFLKKCHGDKPTDVQIRHLLESDARLTGETLERLKRKILSLMKKDKKKPSESPLRTTIPVPPWGGHFFHQDQRIEIVNSNVCPKCNNILS